MPSRVKAGHQSISARRRGPGVRVSSHSAPSGITAKDAAALTPPTRLIASAESAAARRGEPRSAPRTSGSSTHGTRATGQVSLEIGPIVVSTRGERANAAPATRHARSLRTPRARASRAVPAKATASTSPHQSRCTTQPGTARSAPSQKKLPIGHR